MDAFKPLTPEQYSSARSKFSPDQIMQFEQKRKEGASTGQPPVPVSGMTGAPSVPLATRIANKVGPFATGVAKSGIDVLHGLGNLMGLKPNSFGEKVFNATENTDKGNPLKTAGEVSGNVAQFLIPGTGEAKLAAKAGSVIDKIPEALNLGKNAAKYVTGAAKVGTRAAISGTSAGVVGTLQTGDLNKGLDYAKAGAFFGGAGQALESFGSGLVSSLQKSGFKLTPATEAKAAQKAQSAADFMASNKISGTSSTKFSKLENIIENFEKTLQSSLPKKLQIAKDDVIAHVNSILDSLKRTDPAIYTAAKNDVKEAAKILKETNPGSKTIDFGDAFSSKRSYAKQAFKQSRIFDPKVASEGSYAMEQGFQKVISDILDSTNTKIKIPEGLRSFFGGEPEVMLSDFNKVYSNAISAKNFTRIAQFKSDSGVTGRLLGTFLGETMGNAVLPGVGGKVGGSIIGRIGSEFIPGMVRNISERTLSSGAAIPKAAKVGMGIVSTGQK